MYGPAIENASIDNPPTSLTRGGICLYRCHGFIASLKTVAFFLEQMSRRMERMERILNHVRSECGAHGLSNEMAGRSPSFVQTSARIDRQWETPSQSNVPAAGRHAGDIDTAMGHRAAPGNLVNELFGGAVLNGKRALVTGARKGTTYPVVQS
jgi:hypothetical protein